MAKVTLYYDKTNPITLPYAEKAMELFRQYNIRYGTVPVERECVVRIGLAKFDPFCPTTDFAADLERFLADSYK